MESLLPRLQQCMKDVDLATEQEVEAKVRHINQEIRTLLNSDAFENLFPGDQEWVDKCADWSIDIAVPVSSNEVPFVLVDLPGNTEGGRAGEFINTMVKGACQCAVSALLTISPDQLTELQERDAVGPMQRFFAGARTFSGYLVVITKAAWIHLEVFFVLVSCSHRGSRSRRLNA